MICSENMLPPVMNSRWLRSWSRTGDTGDIASPWRRKSRDPAPPGLVRHRLRLPRAGKLEVTIAVALDYEDPVRTKITDNASRGVRLRVTAPRVIRLRPPARQSRSPCSGDTSIAYTVTDFRHWRASYDASPAL